MNTTVPKPGKHNAASVKVVLHACILLAGAAVASVAFAQSADYRRGYDAGYRDGAQAQAQADEQDRGQDRGQGRDRIVIEEANYGTRDSSCDATPALQAAVGYRRQVNLLVDNRLCGDPAENQVKRLTVRYHCGNGATQRARVMEGETLSLSCR